MQSAYMSWLQLSYPAKTLGNAGQAECSSHMSSLLLSHWRKECEHQAPHCGVATVPE